MPSEYQNKELDFEYSNKLLCVNNYYGDARPLRIKVTTKMIESIFGNQNIRRFMRWCRSPNPMSIPGGAWPAMIQTHFGGLTTTQIISRLHCVTGMIYGIFNDQKEESKNKYLYSHAVILFERYAKQSIGRAKGLIMWILDHLRKFNFLCNQKKVTFDPKIYSDKPQIVDEETIHKTNRKNGSYAGYYVLIILLIIAILYIFLYKL